MKKWIAALLSIALFISMCGIGGLSALAAETTTGFIRYDTYIYNINDEAERAAQQAIWDEKMMTSAHAPNIVDSTPYIVSSRLANSYVLYDWLYMHVQGGYVTYSVDFPDRVRSFTIDSWAEFKNCVFLGSKDEGRTWYLIGDGTDLKLGLGSVTMPQNGNASSLTQCEENIQWLLTGNPEKKIWVRIQGVDGMGTAKISNIAFDYVEITDSDTSTDLPPTVPEGYVVPEAYPVAADEEESGHDPTAAFDFSAAFNDHMVLQQNRDFAVFGFGTPGRTVTVTLKKGDTVVEEAQTIVSAEGTWTVDLKAVAGSIDTYTLSAADGYATQTLSDVLFGEVWVTGGQSNMEMPLWESIESKSWKDKERNDHIRLFVQNSGNATALTAPRSEANGEWASAKDWSVIYYNSAISYYFAETLYAELNVPIGIITTAVGGTPIATWMDNAAIEEDVALKEYLESKDALLNATLFNARVAPFAGIEAAGIVWYQGEEDVTQRRYEVFELGIPVLVKSWSRVFGCEDDELLPFVALQLAPYMYNTEECLPLGNEKIQVGVQALNAVGGNAITLPIYNLPLDYTSHPVHPHTKEPVAVRCAHAALGMVYDKLEIYSGPVLTSAVQKGSLLTLTFDNVGDGLCVPENELLAGFQIVDEDGTITKTSAVIKDENTVQITLWNGEKVTSVRYAYATWNGDSNLYNGNGYLALPFRAAVTEAAPDTSDPESSESESSVPEESEPESSIPEYSEPESSAPEVSKPDADENPDTGVAVALTVFALLTLSGATVLVSRKNADCQNNPFC